MLRNKEFRAALNKGDMNTLRYFFYASGGTKDETKLRALLDKNVPRLASLNKIEPDGQFCDLMAHFEMSRFQRLIKNQDWEEMFTIVLQDQVGHLSAFLNGALEITTKDPRVAGICFCAILNCRYTQCLGSLRKNIRTKVKVEVDDYIFRPNTLFMTALAQEINKRGYMCSALNALGLIEEAFPLAFWPFLSLLDDVYIEKWLRANDRTESVLQMRATINYCYLPC